MSTAAAIIAMALFLTPIASEGRRAWRALARIGGDRG